MGRVFVTAVARRDNVFDTGGVADMARQAVQFVSMGHAVALDGGDDGWMAFNAIVDRQTCGRQRLCRFGGGLIGGLIVCRKDDEHGQRHGKIFGCKYYLAYYYRDDALFQGRGGHWWWIVLSVEVWQHANFF